MSVALLTAALVLFAISLVLLIVDVWRAANLSTAARWGWSVAMVIGSFFTITLWFAQGRTGKAGRWGSVIVMLAIGLSVVVIVIETAKVF